MADFPRAQNPRTVGDLELMRGEVTRTQRGIKQRRNTTARGVRWTETWPPLLAGDPDVEALKRFIKTTARNEGSFTIKHLTTPGSGKAPNGTGAAGITVNGADQTGTSLDTTGWTAGQSNVVRDGDVIKVAGIDHIFIVTADADADGSGNATISVDPSILEGNSPSDDAGVTTTDVQIDAYIAQYRVPEAPPSEWMAGLSVTFEELP